MGSFLGGAASGLVQIAIAALIVWIALKFFKDIAKGIIIAVIAVAAFLIVKGIVDWAMIASIGEGLFEWIGTKISEKSAQSANIAMNGINMFIL